MVKPMLLASSKSMRRQGPGEQWKKRAPGCLGYIGDHTTQLCVYRGSTIIRTPIKQPVFHRKIMDSNEPCFFVARLSRKKNTKTRPKTKRFSLLKSPKKSVESRAIITNLDPIWFLLQNLCDPNKSGQSLVKVQYFTNLDFPPSATLLAAQVV